MIFDPKIDPKTTQDEPKTRPRGFQKRSFFMLIFAFDFEPFWDSFWSHFWEPFGPQDRSKIEPKINQDFDVFLIGFLSDFDRLGCQNRAKLAPKWDQESMLTSKGVFFTKRTLAAAGARSAGSRGSKLGTKMDQKSSKK